MAVDPTQKLEALKSELEQIVDNYNKATQVADNCKQRIFELKGAKAKFKSLKRGHHPLGYNLSIIDNDKANLNSNKELTNFSNWVESDKVDFIK